MARKRNLDEIHPLGLASAINPDLAAAVAQASKRHKPEVRPARSIQRRVTDEIVAKVNRQLSGEEIPKGWFTIPATATAAGVLANPIAAVIGTAAASGASQIVDEGSKELTGKNWTENISRGLDINPTFASYTNPGVLAGGLPFTKGAKLIGNTVRGLYNAYRYGNASLQPNAFGQSVIGALRRLAGKNYKNVGTNNIESLPVQQPLALPYNPTNSTTNFGNVVNLPSSNGVINIPDLDIDKRRTLLKRINKIFASRYGYTSLPLSAAKTREATEEAIKGIMTQHNTFVRGVRDKYDFIDRTNELLKQQGLEPTRENRLRWYATHYAPYTGAGRVGFYETDDNLGTIYTSNSFNVARGYGDNRKGRNPGSQYVVRRPLNFSSSNLEDWVTDNEFSFVGQGSTKRGTDYFKYELPYYLRTGKTLRSEYLKEHPIEVPSYRDIDNAVSKRYFSGRTSITEAEARRDRLKSMKNITFEFPRMYAAPNHAGVALANIEDDVLGKLYRGSFYKEVRSKQLKEFFEKHPGYYTINGNNGDFLHVFKDGDRSNHITVIDGPFGFGSEEVNFDSPDYSSALSKELTDFVNSTKNTYLNDKVKGYYYGRYKHLDTEIEKSKKMLQKLIQDEFKKQYVKHANIDIAKYAEEKGIAPVQPRTMLFGDRTGNNATINSKDNPWQHFVFVGPVDKQGLELVRKIPYEEIEHYPSTEGGHAGRWTKGLSRKVKKFGGVINRRTLATGGSIHINPANLGKFNATKARTGKTTEELTH